MNNCTSSQIQTCAQPPQRTRAQAPAKTCTRSQREILVQSPEQTAARPQFSCPIEATLSLIGGKYKTLILWHLSIQPLHYMDLQRLLGKATPKMLSQQLHALMDCGMVRRQVIPEKPPKTVYSLTAFGRSIVPILDVMCQWGAQYLDRIGG